MKAEKQRLKDKAREATWRHQQGLPPVVEVDDREYSDPIDPLQPGMLVDGRSLDPTARHPDEVVFPGGPSQGTQRAPPILGTSVAALSTNSGLYVLADRASQAEQEAMNPSGAPSGRIGAYTSTRVTADHTEVMTVVHRSEGPQRFAEDRGSGTSRDQPPPPKASRKAEPPTFGAPRVVPMTPVVSAAPASRDEPCVYNPWKNPNVEYRDEEAWRVYDNDMIAYHMLRELEGRAAHDDDLGIPNEFPGLEPWQKIPPRPPRREQRDNVPRSSTDTVAGDNAR